MRAALILLLLTSTCTGDVQPKPEAPTKSESTSKSESAKKTESGGAVELRTLGSGSYATAKPDAPQSAAAHDQKTYENLWATMIGGGEMPAVDFGKEAVVFLLAGSRPTGGYSIEARGAAMDGETLVVDAAIKGPPRDSMVTQAFTSPYAVVAVSGAKFKDVRWRR